DKVGQPWAALRNAFSVNLPARHATGGFVVLRALRSWSLHRTAPNPYCLQEEQVDPCQKFYSVRSRSQARRSCPIGSSSSSRSKTPIRSPSFVSTPMVTTANDML